jgi:hypothetical protein
LFHAERDGGQRLVRRRHATAAIAPDLIGPTPFLGLNYHHHNESSGAVLAQGGALSSFPALSRPRSDSVENCSEVTVYP